MKMLARLKYLYDEGFEVASLSGYDDRGSEFNAKILYRKGGDEGQAGVGSELFRVDKEEMEQCRTLFFSRLSGRL